MPTTATPRKSTATKKATTTAKPRKSTAKPKATKTAKRNAAKNGTTNATTRKKATAKRAEIVQAPRVDASKINDRDRTVATKATLTMRIGNEKSSRAPISAPQVAVVRMKLGKTSTATFAKSVGFKSLAQLKRHAGGTLDAMPDGVTSKLAEWSRELTGVAGASKIRGRKLTAIIASL